MTTKTKARKTSANDTPGVPVKAKPPGVVGRSLAEFKSNFDKSFIIPNKIKAALASLGSGWMYEVEFAKHAGISLVDLGHFRTAFEENVLTVGRDGTKRIWAGTRATALRMREML